MLLLVVDEAEGGGTSVRTAVAALPVVVAVLNLISSASFFVCAAPGSGEVAEVGSSGGLSALAGGEPEPWKLVVAAG